MTDSLGGERRARMMGSSYRRLTCVRQRRHLRQARVERAQQAGALVGGCLTDGGSPAKGNDRWWWCGAQDTPLVGQRKKRSRPSSACSRGLGAAEHERVKLPTERVSDREK